MGTNVYKPFSCSKTGGTHVNNKAATMPIKKKKNRVHLLPIQLVALPILTRRWLRVNGRALFSKH